jgi:type VI secretion system protein VasJ
MSSTQNPNLDRGKKWLSPFEGASKAGVNARGEDVFESLMQEVAKLDSPAAAPVDWRKVAELGDNILREKSKDLQVAVYLAVALQQTRGLDGLLDGTALLAGMLQDFWDALFPEVKRIRGRVAALSWFVGKASGALPGASVGPADREKIVELEVLGKHLAQLAREKLQANAPGFGPLLDAVQRKLVSLPPPSSPAPAAPAPSPKPTAPPPQAPPAPVPQTAAPVQSPVAPVAPAAPAAVAAPAALEPPKIPAFSQGSDPVSFLRFLGSELAKASTRVREAKPLDPAAFLMLRQGIWLHWTKAPPMDATGCTMESPMTPNLKRSFDNLVAEKKWENLLQDSEYAVATCPLLFDPHRYSAVALAALGEPAKPARHVVVVLLGAFLRRFPQLVDALASDKTPLADERTKEWIHQEVLAGSGSAKPKQEADLSEEDAAIKESKALAGSGNLASALGVLAKAADRTGNPRSVFRLRLAMADLCRQQGQWETARGLYENLDSEAMRRGLDSWEPTLAKSCVEGLLLTFQLRAKSDRSFQVEPSRLSVLYDRLCLLDPAAALRIVGRAQG